MNKHPSFDLLNEPWITVQTENGDLVEQGIVTVLENAHHYRQLYDPSPLVIVATFRLLIAVLQDIIRPESIRDLVAIWQAGQFDAAAIATFANEYAHRFNLFSESHPFLQSADIPMTADKNAKSVGYLHYEDPPGTVLYHFNHQLTADLTYCPACAAHGLVAIPAYSTSGGAGIKPSINGVPPIYLLPGGETLFQQLAAGLTIPNYQPSTADDTADNVWWRHDPNVGKKAVVNRVSYLHSLTFPARRVRLHPIRTTKPCDRCGRETVWGVSKMVFEMGESRPKESAHWRDPFVAYRSPKKETDPPTPVRPVKGRALWREFAPLFLPQNKGNRPHILNLLDDDDIRKHLPYDEFNAVPIRTVGIRTDMKMKMFEWEINDFELPPHILSDLGAGQAIERGLEFSKEINNVLRRTFGKHLGSERGKKYERLRNGMNQSYWQQLELTFRQFLDQFQPNSDPDKLLLNWVNGVTQIANRVFADTAATIGTDASSLRQRYEGINHCRAAVRKAQNKFIDQHHLQEQTDE